MQPYQIGDKVKAVAFTDCFGEYHPEQRGLVVEIIRLEVCNFIPSYWRIKAVRADNPSLYVEGAAHHYFAPDA